MSERLELQAIFKGKVQGVGFRWTIADYAEQLNLTGSVQNLSDGTVEVIAQGERKSLEHFLDQVNADSGLARIDSVASSYRTPKTLFKSFKIVTSRVY